MRENTNVTTNQNYLIGRTRQEGITTTTMGNLGEENMRDYRIKDTLMPNHRLKLLPRKFMNL